MNPVSRKPKLRHHVRFSSRSFLALVICVLVISGHAQTPDSDGTELSTHDQVSLHMVQLRMAGELLVPRRRDLGRAAEDPAADETVRLTPHRRLSLEGALEFIAADECVEVTPATIRLRKVELDATVRAREAKRRANAASRTRPSSL